MEGTRVFVGSGPFMPRKAVALVPPFATVAIYGIRGDGAQSAMHLGTGT